MTNQFNLEFKITYEELAPSLQDMFKALQMEITDISNGGGFLTDIIENGEEGQVIKINKDEETVYADDNFRNLMIITDDAQIQAIKDELNPSVYLRNVFNTWNRFIHYDNDAAVYMDNTNALYQDGGVDYHGQNQELSDQRDWVKVLDKSVTTNGGWSYNSQENRIYCNFDLGMFAGFISPTPVSNNYYIHFWVDSFQDDDHFCIIIGYMTDDQGVEHTLSYIRAEGQHYNIHKPDTYYGTGLQYIDTRVWSAVVYDLLNPTQTILADNSAKVGVATYMRPTIWRAHVAARRQRRNFTFYTSQWSQEKTEDPEFVEDWTLEFNIPDEKPADWNQTMWDNINTMLELNYFGVGTRSNPSAFSIEEQTGIFPNTETIYNIENDTKWVWNFQTEEYEDRGSITKQDIPYRSLLYCDYYDTFYYYYFPGSYQLITSSGGGGDTSADLETIINQIAVINNNIQGIEDEINDINIALDDLNDRVTILENKDYSSDNFLNLAPKIGYYQEDQISIIDKYNMNNQLYGVIIYPSNRGQIAYCTANTGAYNDNSELKVYRGERSSNEHRFAWDNTPREIGFLTNHPELVIRSFIWCDNYHMIILTRSAGSTIQYYSNTNDCKLWWIDTNNSADETTWTNGIEITNIVQDAYKSCFNIDAINYTQDALHRGTPFRNIGSSGWYYDEDFDTFTFFIYPVHKAHNDAQADGIKCCVYKKNGTKVGIYDMSHYLTAFRFPQYLLDQGYSFSSTIPVSDPDSVQSEKVQVWGEGWCTWSFLYYPEKELCVLLVNDNCIDYFKNGISQKDESVDFTMKWRVPHSIHRGQGGTITKILGNRDMVPLGTDHQNTDNHKYVDNSIIDREDNWNTNSKPFMMQSRDLSTNTIYCGCFFVIEYCKDEYIRRMGYIFHGGDAIDQVEDPKYQGCISDALSANYLMTPDASLWGKSHKYTSAFYDNLWFITENMKTSYTWNPAGEILRYPIINFNGFRCKDFTFYGQDSSGFKIILPKHGLYEYIGDCDRNEVIQYEDATRYSRYGFPGNDYQRFIPEARFDELNRDPIYYEHIKTLCVKENEPYYIMNRPFSTTWNDTTSNIHLECYNTLWKEDLKQFSSELRCTQDISIADNEKYSNMVNADLNREYQYMAPFYNPYGDYWLVSLSDSQLNDTYNSETSGKCYFIIIKNDGTIIPFGRDFSNKWSSNYTTRMNEQNRQAQSNNFYKHQFADCVAVSDKKWYVFHYRYSLFQMDTYNCIEICIEFNDNLTDFTMKDCGFNASTGWSESNLEAFNATGLVDTGMGFSWSSVTGVMMNRTAWKVCPSLIYTQKPLTGDTSGTTYTQDQILDDFYKNSNKYAMYLESNTFPVGYIPAIPIFLGGYFSVIEEPIPIEFTPSQHNYIYLQRDPEDKTNIICEISNKLTIYEGEKMFSRICVADVNCDASQITDVTYYHINIGYNDYKWETGIY